MKKYKNSSLKNGFRSLEEEEEEIESMIVVEVQI